MSQNYINHVAILLDASSSMGGRESDVIKAVDNQIKYLARRSKEMDQETRVSVYSFADHHNIKCMIFDKDVLRLPSIASLYKVYGNTALIDATLWAISDLKSTFTRYGDHSFLIFVFTDGQENNSTHRSGDLSREIGNLPENWTVAALVPNINGKLDAQHHGFDKGNIAVWDVSSITGVEEAMTELQVATDSYMSMRSSGISGTRNLFSTDAKAVNAATIKAAGLKPLDPKSYTLTAVTAPKVAKNPDGTRNDEKSQGSLNKDKHPVWEIQDYVEKLNGPGSFRVGKAFYELSKKEKISGAKQLAVFEVATSRVFTGPGVRALIGLPDADATVAPDFNPSYKIFVQSQSHNRHLVVGTKILVLNN